MEIDWSRMRIWRNNWSSFYQGMLKEGEWEMTKSINRVTNHIPHMITPEQNVSLMREISFDEVK